MKILVAVDASPSSHHALCQTLQLINLQLASFVLLSVEEIVAMQPNLSSSSLLGLGSDIALSLSEETNLVELEEQRSKSALNWAEHFCQQAGVHYVTRFEIGDPKHVICDVAKQEKPDLIVVGSEGRGLVERALIGSVSDYVIHHTPYPVLVVRNDLHKPE